MLSTGGSRVGEDVLFSLSHQTQVSDVEMPPHTHREGQLTWRLPPGTKALRPLPRNTGYHFNLKIKASQPVHSDSSPVWIRWSPKDLLLHFHNGAELLFRIGMKSRNIDYIVKVTTCSCESGFKIVKG